jgi:hypothetical protein
LSWGRTDRRSYVPANMDLLSIWIRLTWTQRSNLELDKMETIFCSMEEEGFRLGADSVVTVPLAGVTPGPDNTERGDDTDSTSDICYIGSDTGSIAGDIPNDTLSANEDGSHVPQ